MSELGVFAVDRGIFDHPILNDAAPFSKREAWLWMLAEAAWKPRAYSISGEVVQLKRGQLAHSIRYMAAAWGWPKTNVGRFLGRLKTGTMIGTEDGTAATIITICKYDTYQRVSLPSGTGAGALGGTEVGQQRDRKEDIQDIKQEVGSETAVPDATPPQRKRNGYPPEFEALWKAYPTDPNMSKLKAFSAWSKLSAEDRPKVLTGVPGFVAYCRKDATYRPVHLVRFITERRFDGYAAASPAVDWPTRLKFARDNRSWSTPSWGPMPGVDGCGVPAELLLDGDGSGWAEYKLRVAG